VDPQLLRPLCDLVLDCGGLELKGFEPADLQEERLQDHWIEVSEDHDPLEHRHCPVENFTFQINDALDKKCQLNI